MCSLIYLFIVDSGELVLISRLANRSSSESGLVLHVQLIAWCWSAEGLNVRRHTVHMVSSHGLRL